MLKLPPETILYNDQFVIRPFSPHDGKAIYETVQQSIVELKRFMPWAHNEMSYETAMRIYADFYAKTYRGQEATFVGFDQKKGTVLFCAALLPESRLNPLALELGYWVASRNTGKGIGTTAAQIMIVLAFQHYGADRLAISCNPENKGSMRIIEKCGFKREAELRNYQALPSDSMLKDGFSAQRTLYRFSLIPDDIPKLSWFNEIASKMQYEY